MPYPDAGFRLLALYRYWNMIQYYFPYKHITKRKWNQVLIQYIPQFLNAKNELNYELAVMGIIAEIQDSHAKIIFGDNKIEKLKGDFYAPVHTRMIKNKLVVTDYYSKDLKETEFFSKTSGLKVGDIITHINNIAVDDLIEQHLYLYPGSNLPARLRSLTPDLLRSDKPSLVITLERNNNLMMTNLTLYKKEQLNIFHWYKKSEGKSYKMLKDNITYVSLNSVQSEDIPQIKKNIFNSKGVIVDIRKRPTNAAALSFAPLLFHEPRPFFKLTHPNIKNPGEFVFSDASMIEGSMDSYQGQVVVLSNEFTQSYGETMTMVFQARKNTKVIGSPTAGANGNVLFLMLPGNIKTLFSGLGVYYPDGNGTQQVGIVPDIHVTPTVKGITEGRDEVLEKAIEFLNTNN